jgi:thiamine biosynthesis lipoprotein
VRSFVDACEARFSRFKEDSELSQLNRCAGSWFDASAEMFDLMQEAVEQFHATGGLFDPSILNALSLAGYDRSIDEIWAHGAAVKPAPDVYHRPDFEETSLDAARRRIRLPAGVQVDFGGIAKGWISTRAVHLLKTYSPVCAVSAGGDMVLWGYPAGESAWPIALEDPRNPEETLALLRIPPGALATSTTTRRRWLQAGRERNHIIDPRSGLPVEPEWLSVTVSAPKATTAEAFAKALLIAGPENAALLAASQRDLSFVAVQKDGSLWGTVESQELIDVRV